MSVKRHLGFTVCTIILSCYFLPKVASNSVSKVVNVPNFRVFSPESGDILRNQIINVDVRCFSKQIMLIQVECNDACKGNVYANGLFNNPNCRFSSNGGRKFEFMLRNNECGTKFSNQSDFTLENTLVFRYDNLFQERRLVRCSWSKKSPDEVTATVSVDMMNIHSVTYSGTSIESQMELLKGESVHSPTISEAVRIGDTLTLMIYVKGINTCHYDVEVKNCIAHNNDLTRVMRLSDSKGCILKDKLMSPWRKKNKFKNYPLVAYSNIQAFRFPGDLDVFFQCQIEVCRFRCPPPCTQYSDDDESDVRK